MFFDDCAGNEGLAFEVSHPNFQVDEEMNLVARRDVMDSGTVMFIHGVNEHADDMAQVDIVGAPPRSPQTLRVSSWPMDASDNGRYSPSYVAVQSSSFNKIAAERSV